jgi:hypothetical protein
VLEHVREGQTNAEIAVRLGISPDGVKFHVSNMLSKLELPDRQALAAWQPSRRPRFAPKMHLGLPGLVGAFKAISLKGGLAIAGGALLVAGGVGGAMALVGMRSDGPDPQAIPDVKASIKVTSFTLTETVIQNDQAAGSSAASIPPKSEIDVSYRAPGGLRLETRTQPVGGPAITSDALHLEGILWSWVPGADRLASWQGVSLPLDPYRGHASGWPVGAPDLRALIAKIAPFSNARVEGETEVAGRPVYVIAAGSAYCPSAPAPEPPQRLWIDKETLFLLKREELSAADGHVLSSSEVTKINYEPQLNDSVFEPPEHGKEQGTQIVQQGITMSVYQFESGGRPGENNPGQVAMLSFFTTTNTAPGADFGCPTPGTVVNDWFPAVRTVISYPAESGPTATPAASAAVGP